MTKAKSTTKATPSGTVAKFRQTYDDGATRNIKTASVPADLVAVESLGIAKLPKPIAVALDAYILGYTEHVPKLKARAAHTLAALEAAPREQVEKDAVEASAILVAGPEAFGKLAGAIEATDAVAVARQNHEAAQRLYRAMNTATDGQMKYLGVLVGGEYRDAFMAMLDKAWAEYVTVTATDDMTMGDFKTAQHLSIEARNVIGRLLMWAEGANHAVHYDLAESKRLRAALRDEEWTELPTLARVTESDTAAARNADDEAETEKAKTLAEARAADERYAAIAAQNRRGIYAVPRREGDGSRTESDDSTQGVEPEQALASAK